MRMDMAVGFTCCVDVAYAVMCVGVIVIVMVGMMVRVVRMRTCPAENPFTQHPSADSNNAEPGHHSEGLGDLFGNDIAKQEQGGQAQAQRP